MEWHFGYNCRNFVPALQKCRKLVDEYGKRSDLLEQKWLRTPDLFAYLNLPKDALLAKVSSGEIATKRQKDGTLTFKVSGAWGFDDCFLKASGGQCLYFESHNGRLISCLADLKTFDAGHPNCRLAPSEAEVKAFEDEVLQNIEAALPLG